MGPMGAASKLKGPLKDSQAETEGSDGGLAEKVEGEFSLRRSLYHK